MQTKQAELKIPQYRQMHPEARNVRVSKIRGRNLILVSYWDRLEAYNPDNDNLLYNIPT